MRKEPDLSSKQTAKIRELYATGDCTMRALAERFSVSMQSIKRIVDHNPVAETEAKHGKRQTRQS